MKTIPLNNGLGGEYGGIQPVWRDSQCCCLGTSRKGGCCQFFGSDSQDLYPQWKEIFYDLTERFAQGKISVRISEFLRKGDYRCRYLRLSYMNNFTQSDEGRLTAG